MAEPEAEELDELPKKKGKGLLIGLVLALLGGAGGFYATFSGMVGGADTPTETSKTESDDKVTIDDLPPIAFVPLDPMVISINAGSSRHLRFRAELEVAIGYEEEVILLKPRILDVLNSYLRAVDADEFERPGSLIDLRAQMLRRIQLVTGDGRVRDLLIAEFVIS